MPPRAMKRTMEKRPASSSPGASGGKSESLPVGSDGAEGNSSWVRSSGVLRTNVPDSPSDAAVGAFASPGFPLVPSLPVIRPRGYPCSAWSGQRRGNDRSGSSKQDDLSESAEGDDAQHVPRNSRSAYTAEVWRAGLPSLVAEGLVHGDRAEPLVAGPARDVETISHQRCPDAMTSGVHRGVGAPGVCRRVIALGLVEDARGIEPVPLSAEDDQPARELRRCDAAACSGDVRAASPGSGGRVEDLQGGLQRAAVPAGDGVNPPTDGGGAQVIACDGQRLQRGPGVRLRIEH